MLVLSSRIEMIFVRISLHDAQTQKCPDPLVIRVPVQSDGVFLCQYGCLRLAELRAKDVSKTFLCWDKYMMRYDNLDIMP